MKILIINGTNKSYVEDLFYEDIEFVKSLKNQDKADLVFSGLDWSKYIDNLNFYHNNPNHVIDIRFQGMRVREGLNLRKNYNVDNCIDLPYHQIKNIMFSNYDFHKKNNIIPVFSGPTHFEDLKKPQLYWTKDKLPRNNVFHNKVFWKGSLSTHFSRKEIYNFYKNIDDSRFNIEAFKLNIYKNQSTPEQFDYYMKELCCKDIVFILRGDRPWANSFYDVIRAGCIPVMISSMNNFGWENIIKNVDDYFLRFDIRTQTMDHIHEQVCKLLDDKDRVLQMKSNIRKLYKTFFDRPCPFGASEFIWGKCLNLYKNNFDTNKIDGKFICSDVLDLKGLPGKL